MSHLRRKSYILMLIIGLLAFSPSVNAQEVDADLLLDNLGLLSGDLELDVSPSSPRANSSVRAEVYNPNIDLRNSTINWFLDGVAIAGGKGIDEVSFKVGDTGSVHRLGVTLFSPNGLELSASRTIRIADVSIVWQADTWVPPFYKGKALPSNGSNINFSTVENIREGGRLLGPSELYYEWELDFEPIEGASGFGVNRISLPANSIYSPLKISVTVSSPNNTVSARDNITINSVEPEVLFYENDPLLGPRYGRVLGKEYNLFAEEFIVLAEPFFFPRNLVEEDNLRIRWSLDGRQALTNPKSPRNLTLRQSGLSGSSIASILFAHPTNLLMEASKDLLINFGL